MTKIRGTKMISMGSWLALGETCMHSNYSMTPVKKNRSAEHATGSALVNTGKYKLDYINYLVNYQ